MKKARPKILCLGVSYPCVAASLERQQRLSLSSSPPAASASSSSGEDDDAAASTMSAVDSTIQLVAEKVLTQMDARDLVRCQATEEHCGVDVFCVSQEQGAMYRPDRHLEANFNGRHFVKHLQQHFEGCQFDQIVLDYFWIPPAWNQNHWKRAFFEKTLVAFAESRLLRIASNPLDRKYPRGAIYLPFCFHCFKEVVATFDKLSAFYNVSFLRKGELGHVAFWSGTQTIDARTMQSIFGKQLDQEEMYCTITQQQLKSMEDDPDISRTALMEIASSLEDFSEIRFLVLEPLPSLLGRTRNREASGRFLGLVHPSMVKNGVGRKQRAVVTPLGQERQLPQQHQPCLRRSERKRTLVTAFEEDHHPQPKRKSPSTRAIVNTVKQPGLRTSKRQRNLEPTSEEDHHQQPQRKSPCVRTMSFSEQEQATRKSPRVLSMSPTKDSPLTSSVEEHQQPAQKSSPNEERDLPPRRPPAKRKRMQVQKRVNEFRVFPRVPSPDVVTDDLSHVDDLVVCAVPPAV